jgi:hypothetical protein
MAKFMNMIEPGKTYATEDNCHKAVEKLNTTATYIVAYTKEGRVYPIFSGTEAIRDGLFHRGFICIG